MRPSNEIINFIKTVEGYATKPYLDTAGYWTIGIGALIKGNNDLYLETILGKSYELEVLELTEQQVNDLFELHSREKMLELNEFIRREEIKVNQQQYDALCSFVFNLGLGKSVRNSSVFRNIKRGDYEEAAESFLLWNKSGRPLKFDQGVYNRRVMEMNIFKAVDMTGNVEIPTHNTRKSDRNYIESTVIKYKVEFFRNNT